MKERACVLSTWHIAATLAANYTLYFESPWPVVIAGAKAWASNDSSATLALAGGATITAAAIGDSANPAYLEPTSNQQVAADTLVTLTLDYDGAGGTASEDVGIILFGYIGD
jgi:hypothetical protein